MPAAGKIAPALRVGMQPVTLRVTPSMRPDAERPGRRYHAERGNEHVPAAGKIAPALRVGMQPVTLRVTPQLRRDAERPRWRYHAERGNEHVPAAGKIVPRAPRGNAARDAPRHTLNAAGRGASWAALPRRALGTSMCLLPGRSFPRSAWECSPVTLRVTPSTRPDAERPGRRYHAERWERADQNSMRTSPFGTLQHDRM